MTASFFSLQHSVVAGDFQRRKKYLNQSLKGICLDSIVYPLCLSTDCYNRECSYRQVVHTTGLHVAIAGSVMIDICK